MNLFKFFKRHEQLFFVILFLCLSSSHSYGSESTISEAGRRLVAAYPDHLREVRGNILVWKDGTEMLLDDEMGAKEFWDLMETPDLEDMFTMPYPKNFPSAPQVNQDPGRIRSQLFFEKMYGTCTKGNVGKHLIKVPWLKAKGGGTLKVTDVNDLAKKISALSEELEKLPSSYDKYLLPSEGGYFCRTIEGTTRLSPHAYGIAIDISTKKSDYWHWQTSLKTNPMVWRNSIPYEIVKIFEKHGFIWGGRWYHFDTLHFEYRPELLIE